MQDTHKDPTPDDCYGPVSPMRWPIQRHVQLMRLSDPPRPMSGKNNLLPSLPMLIPIEMQDMQDDAEKR